MYAGWIKSDISLSYCTPDGQLTVKKIQLQENC